MGRYTLILLVLIALAVAWWSRRMRSRLSNEEREELERLRRAQRRQAGLPSKAEGAVMIPCAHCGTYFKESEALWREDKAYCSKACRDAHGASYR